MWSSCKILHLIEATVHFPKFSFSPVTLPKLSSIEKRGLDIISYWIIEDNYIISIK